MRNVFGEVWVTRLGFTVDVPPDGGSRAHREHVDGSGLVLQGKYQCMDLARSMEAMKSLGNVSTDIGPFGWLVCNLKP